MSNEIQNTNLPVVIFRNVTKTYSMGDVKINALNNISFNISRRRFSMVVGPSGSGKTSLLNLIGCLDTPTQGQIIVNGREIQNLTDDELSEFRSQNIAFIFQSFNLIPVLSAFENIEYPLILQGLTKNQRNEKTWHILKSVGLDNHAHHRPNQLSGGQRQRVAIARALVKNPEIVLADEPTANLDSKTGDTIIELMYKMQNEFGATFIFSTHDPNLISHAVDVFNIRDGKIESAPNSEKTQQEAN